MSDVQQNLRGHRFFRDFDDLQVARLAAGAETIDCLAGTRLMRYQHPADFFLVLLTGQVVLLNHLPGTRVEPLETITAPDVVGWSWLLAPFEWHFDVRARTDISAVRINTTPLLEALAEDSEFACKLYRSFMALLVERLQAARLHGLDVYAAPGGARL